jgi:hypothetical protein
MSTEDKILEAIKANPASSSEKIFDILKKDPTFTDSLRTTQRHISSLHKAGLIRANSLGRSTVYTYGKAESTAPQDYALTRAWTELYAIQEQLHSQQNVTDNVGYGQGFTHTLSGSPVAVYYRLRTFIPLLPQEVKEIVKDDLKEIDAAIINSHGRWLSGPAKEIGEPHLPPTFLASINKTENKDANKELVRDQEPHYLKKQQDYVIIADLLGKISDALNKYMVEAKSEDKAE